MQRGTTSPERGTATGQGAAMARAAAVVAGDAATTEGPPDGIERRAVKTATGLEYTRVFALSLAEKAETLSTSLVNR